MSVTSERMLQVFKEKRMTYEELAQITGLKRATLQRYATGVTPKVPMTSLLSIANALGVSSAWLAGWTDDRNFTYSNETEPGSAKEELGDMVQRLTEDQAGQLLGYAKFLLSKV